MVSYFTVLGSCSSRDIFNSQINENYKEYFKIGEDGFRQSIASLMLKPVNYTDSLKIYPENDYNKRASNWIKKDLEKRFLQALKENDFEYLLLDTYADVTWGLIDIGEGNYITKNQQIEKTEFFKNLKTKRYVTIQRDMEEFLPLWKKSCDLLFEFLSENCPNTRVILNPNRHVYNYVDCDNNLKKSEKLQVQCKYNNRYRDILDKYIIENFDVDVLEFDIEKNFADENHFWSFYSVHYTKDYFTNQTAQLNEIIRRDKLLNNPECEDINSKIREYKRRLLLEKINRNMLLNSISKFDTARIDIKNIGEKNNVNIISNSDIYSREFRPDWIKDDTGEGVIVESYNGSIDLKLQCVNDGTLRLALRSLDVKDINNYRFPIYIAYTHLSINDEEIFNGNILTYHNKPKIITKNVKDNEIVDIHIEWQPITHDSDYVNVDRARQLEFKKSEWDKKYKNYKKSIHLPFKN